MWQHGVWGRAGVLTSTTDVFPVLRGTTYTILTPLPPPSLLLHPLYDSSTKLSFWFSFVGTFYTW